MFYEGDEVRTCSKVTQKTKDILVANGIKPGQKGIVISEVTIVTVNFGGKIVTLDENALESTIEFKPNNNFDLDDLKGLFGMK